MWKYAKIMAKEVIMKKQIPDGRVMYMPNTPATRSSADVISNIISSFCF